MGYIYKITNTVNNKSYVGYTTNPQARWSDHKYGRGNKVVHQAIKKYGLEKFTFEVIAEDTVDNEQQYINEHNTMYPNGYNLTEGGSLPPNHKGKTYKEIYGADWKQQIIKRQQSNRFKHDMPHTKATKEKIRKKLLGEGNGMYGKKHSKKTLKLMSDKRKGVHVGSKNGNAKRFLLIAPDGEQYQTLGNLKAMCDTLNLNFATVRKSYELNRPMRSGWQVKRL